MTIKKQSGNSFLLAGLLLLSALAYYMLAYEISRENFEHVFSLFSLLFAFYFICYKTFSQTHFRHLVIAGILFRTLLLFSIPNLSDDVYRFIWDGRLAANGINPFGHLPAEIIQTEVVSGIDATLYEQLNSPTYYSIYPPLLQVMFWAAAKVFPENVYGAIIFFKFVIILFEFGNSILLRKLLKKLSLPKHLSLLYILNPLVIIELSGNVHFEGVMIFFVLLSFLLLFTDKWKASAICLGLGIATKLLPILFLPLIIKKVGLKKGLLYAAIAGTTTLLLFALLFDFAAIQNAAKSVDLFFRKFEFNASIYYIVRWIGTLIMGYNLINYAGPVLSLIAAVIIVFLSFKTTLKNEATFIMRALFIMTVFFLFATTVHPWYICMPAALAVFTPFRYAFIWSFTATLSYAAYQYNPVQENLWLIGGGYVLMFSYALWEFKRNDTFLTHPSTKII
jgi:hypothetical protein